MSRKDYCCENCKKAFAYELALHLHEERCGKPKPKPFKCTFADCGKCFARKSTLEHHQQPAHLSQLDCGTRRKLEEESEKEVKKIKLPEKVEGVLPADKVVYAMKGVKVNAFFYTKTESQRIDQQVFFKKRYPAWKSTSKKSSRRRKPSNGI